MQTFGTAESFAKTYSKRVQPRRRQLTKLVATVQELPERGMQVGANTTKMVHCAMYAGMLAMAAFNSSISEDFSGRTWVWLLVAP
jgi:hypothetical protein